MSSTLRNEGLRMVIEAARAAYNREQAPNVSSIRWATVVIQTETGFTVQMLTVGSVPGGILRETADVTSLTEARDWIRRYYQTLTPRLLFIDAPVHQGREFIAFDLDTFGAKVIDGDIVVVDYGIEAAAA